MVLAVAELFLTTAVYMQLPILSQEFMNKGLFSAADAGTAVGAYALGLYALGPICGWLSQRYRRNKVFIISTFGMAATFTFIWLFYRDDGRSMTIDIYGVWLSCFLFGAFYGLSKRLLTSTLMIDKCESFNRTEANYKAVWCSHIALAVGPAVAIGTMRLFGTADMCLFVYAAMFISIFAVTLTKFPFKTPDDNLNVFSSDRFFLFQGWRHFIVMLCVAFAAGMTLTMRHSMFFYLMLLLGFVVAMLAKRVFEWNGDGKQVIIVGLESECLSLFLLGIGRDIEPLYIISSFLMGIALGLTGSYVLFRLLRTSNHCQRGTAVSTYFLAIESGLALGLSIGYVLFFEREGVIPLVAFMVCFLGLVLKYVEKRTKDIRHREC